MENKNDKPERPSRGKTTIKWIMAAIGSVIIATVANNFSEWLHSIHLFDFIKIEAMEATLDIDENNVARIISEILKSNNVEINEYVSLFQQRKSARQDRTELVNYIVKKLEPRKWTEEGIIKEIGKREPIFSAVDSYIDDIRNEKEKEIEKRDAIIDIAKRTAIIALNIKNNSDQIQRVKKIIVPTSTRIDRIPRISIERNVEVLCFPDNILNDKINKFTVNKILGSDIQAISIEWHEPLEMPSGSSLVCIISPPEYLLPNFMTEFLIKNLQNAIEKHGRIVTVDDKEIKISATERLKQRYAGTNYVNIVITSILILILLIANLAQFFRRVRFHYVTIKKK